LTDFAIVVGIAQYPLMTGADGLRGPDNDAKAVYDWLVDKKGGGLQRKNVKLIRSAKFKINPKKPRPNSGDIDGTLDTWLQEKTKGASLDRLYLYFSGHGFSPRLEEAALFTAESTETVQKFVYATSWVRWFRTANRFREIVLWMDSCMNYQLLIPVAEVARPVIGTAVPGPAFTAVAAQTKSALEDMFDGQVHGVFTWALLKGLGGGAADDCGRVTGDSLRSFLFTVMPEFLPGDAKNSTAVDLSPLVRADDGMVFLRLEDRPTFGVVLNLPPAAVGKELRIWTGRPLRLAVSETLTSSTWEGRLLRGLYMAEVPDMFDGPADALRDGFQVSGAGDVTFTVVLHGPKVTVPKDVTELFWLKVVTDNAAAAISVMDYQFGRIFRETGELHEREMAGVYKVRVEFGRDITMISDRVLLLDRDGWPGGMLAPQLASPAPIPGSVSAPESPDARFEDMANRDIGRFTGPEPGRSAISLMASYWTETGGAAPTAAGVARPPHPMHDLQLVDAEGRPVADLLQDCQVELPTAGDPTAVWEREVPPGNYFLRRVLPGGRQYEGCLTASPGWATQIVLQRAAEVGEAADQSDAIADVAVFMRQPGRPPAPGQDAVIEGARLALIHDRNLFEDGRGEQLSKLLLTECTDPIGGIIGAHLLLQARAIQGEQFDSVVKQLRELVGPDHPDVEALSLRCTDVDLRTSRPFTAPPMFRHSWQLITEASYQRAELLPMKLWQRVHASVALGATFVWAADEPTRAAHAAQLSHWISQYPEPPLPDEVRDAACRLQVPAVASTALWAERDARQQKQAHV
jgi:Caspase domain